MYLLQFASVEIYSTIYNSWYVCNFNEKVLFFWQTNKIEWECSSYIAIAKYAHFLLQEFFSYSWKMLLRFIQWSASYLHGIFFSIFLSIQTNIYITFNPTHNFLFIKCYLYFSFLNSFLFLHHSLSNLSVFSSE